MRIYWFVLYRGLSKIPFNLNKNSNSFEIPYNPDWKIHWKLSLQFVRCFSQTVQPCLHPSATPTVSPFPTTSRTPTRLSAADERAGAVAVIFRFYYLRAHLRSEHGCARSSPASTTRFSAPAPRLPWDRERARANGSGLSVRGTLSWEAHLIPGEGYAHSRRSFAVYARNWWSIRTSGAGRPPPIHGNSSRSLDRGSKVDCAINKISAPGRGLRSFFATHRWTFVCFCVPNVNNIRWTFFNRSSLS